MASLLLIVQIWDAINDPIIGAMVDADTHKYRRNKFLAYIWFGAIGLTVAGALCYLPFPQAPGMVKNILFVAGYMIWDAFYTVANVPYGSMLSLISDDPIQRAQLSTFRSIGSMGGALLTGMLIPVIIYDNQNNLRGEQMFVIALIMGLIGLVCFRFMVTNTKVRVDTTITLKEDAPKFNVMRRSTTLSIIARLWAQRWHLSQRLLVCMVPLLQARSCSRLISRMQRSPALWV